MMDKFWDQDYFRVPKITACLVGQWPYQSSKEVILPRVVLVILVIGLLIPRFRALYLHSDNPEVVMSVTTPIVMDSMLVVKTFTNAWNLKRMKFLMNKIYENFELFSDDELQVLREWTAEGKKICKIYLGALFGGVGIFITQPLQQELVNLIMRANATNRHFPVPVDYGPIDMDKYYWRLSFLTAFTTGYMAVLTVACATLFIMLSYHTLGFFATLGYIINHLPIATDDGPREELYVKRCIQLHYRAIEFAQEVEEIYMWYFLGVIGLNMILISIIGVEIVAHVESVGGMIQYGSATLLSFSHLFVECLIGQHLIDQSVGIQEHVANSEWYGSSIKSQKMLNLLLMRSQYPCQMTAGKVLVINMESYSTIIRTSASYFTVLLAMQ